MATLITKRGNGVPSAAVLSEGELAIDLLTGRVYTKSGGVVIEVGQDTHPLDFVNDVDTTTTPPADGDILTYDGASNSWIPVANSGTPEDNELGVESPRSAWKQAIQIPNGLTTVSNYTPAFDTREITIPNPIYVVALVQKGNMSNFFGSRAQLNNDNGDTRNSTTAPGINPTVEYGFMDGTLAPAYKNGSVYFAAWSHADVVSAQTPPHNNTIFFNFPTCTPNNFQMYAIFVINGDKYDINNFAFGDGIAGPNGDIKGNADNAIVPNKPNGFGIFICHNFFPTQAWMYSETFPPTMKFNGSAETADVYPGSEKGESAYMGVNWDTGTAATLGPSWREPVTGFPSFPFLGGMTWSSLVIGK